MKLLRKALNAKRQALDSKIGLYLAGWSASTVPRRGWLRAVREALGMTAAQLGKRLKTDAAGVFRLEEREVKKSATLETLEKAAKAMGCKLIYAFVPNEPFTTLEEIVVKRSQEVARNEIQRVSHSMRLEKQNLKDAKQIQKQIDERARMLRETLDRKLWE